MTRSSYKPNWPTEKTFIDKDPVVCAFYRCDDKTNARSRYLAKLERVTERILKSKDTPKPPPVRLSGPGKRKQDYTYLRIVSKRPRSCILRHNAGYRLILHTGHRQRYIRIFRKMAGHKLHEFRRTKEIGSKIHVGNRLERKRNKKRAQLQMEAHRRKTKKKKSKMQLRRERNKAKREGAKAKARALQK